MRHGLPVIALVVSVAAFVVALAGVLTRGPSEAPEAPEDMLRAAGKQLSDVADERKETRKELDRLAKDVTRAIEAGPAGRAPSLDPAQVRDIAKREVDAALRKRLGEEAAKAKAKVERSPLAGERGADEPAKKAAEPSAKLKEFNDMLAEIDEAFKLDKMRSARVRGALTQLREELNRVFKDARDGKIKDQDRDSRASAARRRADDTITGVLGRRAFERFKKWRAESEKTYVRRFFGL
jgi:hypothetical protein